MRNRLIVNMSVLQPVSNPAAALLDTAIHEEPEARSAKHRPWYANYEWKRRELCKANGITRFWVSGL